MNIPDKLSQIASKISEAIACANGTTGKSDTSLFQALTSLAEGYLGDLPLKITTGTVDFTEETQIFEVEHNSGCIPKCILLYPENGEGSVTSTSEILCSCLIFCGTYEQSDDNNRPLTGENSKYSLISNTAAGICIYRYGEGMKSSNVSEPDVQGVTDDGVTFYKYTNTVTAFTPFSTLRRYAPATYRWIILADKL
ncbi:MAG: hypothetical protein PUC29_01210 [Clostridia bacterium]|nr:hypothetical protein [Clostridia bacterium]